MTYSEIYNQAKGSLALLTDGERALQTYTEHGIPANIREAVTYDYGLNLRRLPIPVNPYTVFHCDVPALQSYLYFVVNDIFYKETSARNATLPEGVIICSLQDALAQHPDKVKPYLGKQSDKLYDGVAALSSMFAQDGFFIYVPDNTTLDFPIQIINVMRSDVPLMASAHNLVVIGKYSKAQLLVCDHAMDRIPACANRVTEVFAAEGAQYEHYKLEDTHPQMCNLATLLVEQERESDVNANLITLRGGVTRNFVQIEQIGEHATSTLCGMSISGGKQLTDNSTRIVHAVPNGKSKELFKLVLNDESVGAFSGELKVLPDAQHTEAYQTNRNILLSDTAKVYTKPQLEIYADDVRCSHGATTGQLDETALFYMQQRCISMEEARMLLMNAFVADVLGEIHIPQLQERIAALVDRRLRGLATNTDENACAACHKDRCTEGIKTAALKE